MYLRELTCTCVCSRELAFAHVYLVVRSRVLARAFVYLCVHLLVGAFACAYVCLCNLELVLIG